MRGIEVANYVQSLFAIHSAFNLFDFAVKVLQSAPVHALKYFTLQWLFNPAAIASFFFEFENIKMDKNLLYSNDFVEIVWQKNLIFGETVSKWIQTFNKISIAK